jgi:hypothetical protein
MKTLEEIKERLQQIAEVEPEVRKVADAKREEYIALVKERIELLDEMDALRMVTA